MKRSASSTSTGSCTPAMTETIPIWSGSLPAGPRSRRPWPCGARAAGRRPAGWWLLMCPRPRSACSGWRHGCPEASLIRFRSCISSSPAFCANKKRVKAGCCVCFRFDCVFSWKKPEWVLLSGLLALLEAGRRYVRGGGRNPLQEDFFLPVTPHLYRYSL